ncbi:MAG: peptide ABC transporter permease [Deltaproteobacteria bacterium HGW-Deltaproteobacteria-18]|nr:MAG: peptide ABC transporter permease [Deltaproteobacteria bacterium HGW-Deltaproteobacteria-18]
MILRRLILALVCLVLACGPALGGVEEHLRALASIPDRAVGTAGEAQTAEHVRQVFESLEERLGATTGRQEFLTPVRVFHSASLTVDGRMLPVRPLFANAMAPESLAVPHRAGLVHVGDGRLEDFDGKDVAGNIVLMNLDSGQGWQHAANLGARALVYLDRGGDIAPRLRFRDKEELAPVDFPRFWIPADEFRTLLGPPEEANGLTATLDCRAEWAKGRSANLWCLVPGQDPSMDGEILMVEAFLDGGRYVPGHAPGADEAVSLATLLHLAETFQEAPPRRPVLLMASSAHGNALTGLREAVWALFAKDKDIAAELGDMETKDADARDTSALLEAGRLHADDARENDLIIKAIQTEIRNEVERLNVDLRLARKDQEANAVRIREMAARKLLLRKVGWEASFAGLGDDGLEAVRAFVPSALKRSRRMAADIADRLGALRSALALKEAVDGRRMAAAVSLHLSSHGNGVGSVDDGWLFQLTPRVNRTKSFANIRPVLKNATRDGDVAYRDLLGGVGRKTWFNNFPDQPPMGGEVLALAGMPGFTLATLNDMRPAWGTPYDTLEHVDRVRAQQQADMVVSMIRALDGADLPEPSQKAAKGFATLSGRANFLRQGELFPEQEAEGALLQIYQDQHYALTWVDSLGRFKLAGLADKKHSFGKAIIEGYRFEPGANTAAWAIDKAATGKDRYRVKLGSGMTETDLIMFGCTQTTLFDLREARNLNPLTRINLLDARTDTEPLRYWYSRVDTRRTTLCSIFLDGDTPFKATLSDTVLQRKLLLLNNSPEDMLGKGFPAATTPAVLNTSLQAAQDMVNLVQPRVENLESHSIVNQRVRLLLSQARDHLQRAEEARDNLMHSVADRNARACLSLISRVYNDVEGTQKDVLGGVLFYIALFVPFAYCLERLLFAHVSINKRIASFLALLCAVIAIVYSVHPAFELTYSPLVVVLAFFILGLSILVSLILFTRFEQEMKNLQRRAMVSRDQAISLWGAFVAAFSIGVTNLRRRKVRTGLTCATLIILTYTLLNFTTVKHSLDQGAVRFQPSSPYHGVMLKALEWRSLPNELDREIVRPGEAVPARRVWWETADRTRPPAIVVAFGDREAEAAGLVGLDPGEATLAAGRTVMVQGDWIDDSEGRQVLLSESVARELGITELEAGTEVRIWGIPFAVRGIFDGDSHDKALDLDGEPLTTVIYPNEVSSDMSEAEAEAAESGQDIATMSSRYQHVPGSRTLIVPATTLLRAGGVLKSLALPSAPGLDHHNLSASLADRYQLLLFHGEGENTWLHYSSSTLSYGGMGNVLIPSVIAILIVLNTMVGSVVERKREIAVYTSVGLAPPHVSSLFIAEALAFGIISAVTGYLAAQVAAHFLAGTPIWAGMTANYSSLAGVGAMITVMAVVLLSVIYPSRVAAHIAIPDVTRTWKLPPPEGSTLVVTLPFLIKLHEQECAGGFLAEYYLAHADISHGLFSTDDLEVEYACPVGLRAEDHPECFDISFRAWLAPFDFGIRQRVSIISCPSPDYPGFLEMRATLTREAGERNAWLRLCRTFLNDLRKQLLIWRSLGDPEKEKFERFMQERMNTEGGAA